MQCVAREIKKVCLPYSVLGLLHSVVLIKVCDVVVEKMNELLLFYNASKIKTIYAHAQTYTHVTSLL